VDKAARPKANNLSPNEALRKIKLGLHTRDLNENVWLRHNGYDVSMMLLSSAECLAK